MHPNAVYNVRIGGHVAPQSILFAVLAFGFMYMVSVVSMTLILVFSGLDILSSFTAVVASINNMGPGLGIVLTLAATLYFGLQAQSLWVQAQNSVLGLL